jgi:dissimilatory sulfite reductase (desulfoviridin) alpha/beta subunit
MALGVLRQKKNCVCLRILGDACEFTAHEMQSVACIASSFGNGKITATSRGTLEINGIPSSQEKSAEKAARSAGLHVDGTGMIVRAVVSCKGTECPMGLFDVHDLAHYLEQEFLGLSVPKKFKIGVFGCPNSTGKAWGQDAGILPVTNRPDHFKLSIGGMMGKSPCFGRTVPLEFSRDQLIPAIHILINFYNTHALSGERFGTMLIRLGDAAFQELEDSLCQII